MHIATYTRIVRASGWYDLLVTAPFATPWTFALLLPHLSSVNQRLGGAPLPAFEPVHMLFAGLMGCVVLSWSVLRIQDPQPRYGRYDGTGRFLFSLWMAWLFVQTGMPVLWLFFVPELAWGIVQWLPVTAGVTSAAAPGAAFADAPHAAHAPHAPRSPRMTPPHAPPHAPPG